MEMEGMYYAYFAHHLYVLIWVFLQPELEVSRRTFFL